MAGKSSKPSFFWQGMLILLPVLLLALGSLASLRWDEQSVERDARQKAAQSVQSLAEVLHSSVDEEIKRFNDIQDGWATIYLYNASEPGLTQGPDDHLMAEIEAWKRDYPALKLADLATRTCVLRNDGRLIDPPDTPVAPSPPRWYRELSSEQRDLWQTLRERVDDDQDYGPAHKAFIDSGISSDAGQAATNLEQRLKYKSLPLYGWLFLIAEEYPDTEYSESGISFTGILLERMLSDRQTQLSLKAQETLWSEIIEAPTFIAPTLLKMAEDRTNGADSATCETIQRMRQLWELQSKERVWVEPLRDLPEFKQRGEEPNFSCRWAAGPAGEAVAFGAPYQEDRGPDAVKIEGQAIYFLPRQVLEAAFSKALTGSKFLIPTFAGVALTVEGKTFKAPHHIGNGDPELLGTATGKFGDRGPDVAKFELKFLLTSKEQMLSAERHRAKLFGLLIVGAVGAALIGFVSARRAFRTQLQLSDAKSNFVSSVSHELRAPIASVRLMAESLERGKIQESQKQNQYFQFIVQECRRLSSLIENVLDFSRIEQGRKQYEFEPTDLAALVHETVKLMEPYAAERGVRLIIRTDLSNAGLRQTSLDLPQSSQSNFPLPKGEGQGEGKHRSALPHGQDHGESAHSALRTSNSELDLDGRAIQQALVNLIDNAIKHSAKGQIVTVGLAYNDSRTGVSPASDLNSETGDNVNSIGERQSETGKMPVLLYVEDHGPGIPPEEHEKIFERFYRLGSELRRETQGVGIGLSIVKHIVTAHGGRVTVRSDLGHGSRFTIELPQLPNHSRTQNKTADKLR